MNDNDAPATPVDLVGQGPFELPICADADLRLGDKLAVIDLTTLEGHLVQVPITLAALAGLHEVIGRALGHRGGDNDDARSRPRSFRRCRSSRCRLE